MVLDFVSALELRNSTPSTVAKRHADRITQLLAIVNTAPTDELRKKNSLDIVAIDPWGAFATSYIHKLSETVARNRAKYENRMLDDLTRQRALQTVRATERELCKIWVLQNSDPA